MLPYAAITRATNHSETELQNAMASASMLLHSQQNHTNNNNNNNNSSTSSVVSTTRQQQQQNLQTLAKEILRTIPSPPEYKIRYFFQKESKTRDICTFRRRKNSLLESTQFHK
jgi:hypothetical protein